MNATRRTLLTALTFSLGALAAGCGASSAPQAKGAAAPGAPASDMAPAPMAASEGYAPSEPGGYGQASQAPMTATAPAPPPSPSKSSAPSGGAVGALGPSAKPSVADKKDSGARSEVAPEPADRPGLGTEWGETRVSRINTVPFVRADAGSPFATGMLYYNDAQGASAMSSAAGYRRTTGGTFSVGGGPVLMGLRDDRSAFLNGFVAGGRDYIVGEAGRRYTIVLRNRTSARYECVVSVDGLDVLDGKPASFSKRGYIIDPNGELEIDGFRQSNDTVAAFRFGSVRGSYANQKHGDTRNVGVIGVALFHERGTNPFPWTQEEIDKRRDANPFPGQFATPPGQ